MQNDTLSRANAENREYESPACEMIVVGTQRVICASETEHVGEEDGQW
jgi:hypothetical protein